ncbi:DMT family transporter [Pseudovibrio denitrificans]|nr:DMT family transporter [Pseudovibrio denitrificans]
MLASGVFGLILYLTITQTLPKLGATSAVLLIIVGQLLAGMVIDHFGLFDLPIRSIDLSRLLAAVLLITGAYLMVR